MFYHTITTGLAICAGAMAAQGAEWLQDIEAAKAQAKAENKAVLLFFTGSDWCGWCVRLHSSIFNTPAFARYAQDKFVLTLIDLPHNTAKLSPAILAQNKALAAKYGISTYPSVLVLTPEEEVLGGFIGGRDTQEQVIAPLDDALRIQQKIQAAEQLSGIDRAQALTAIYNEVPAALKGYFRPMRNEIAACDPHNTTGIHHEIAAEQQINKLRQDISTAGTDLDTAMKIYDKALQDAPATNKAAISSMRMEYLERHRDRLIQTANGVEDVLELKKLLLKMADYSSTADAKALHAEVEAMFRDPEAVLQMLKIKQQTK